jgi:glycopeptide antibiotics resistance protein
MIEAPSKARGPFFNSTTAAWLWACSALFIIYGTSLPFNFTSEPGWAAQKLARVSLNVFMSPVTGRRASVPDMVQNVLLFVPFGLFGLLALGWRTYGIWRAACVIVLGASLSASVEILQLFTVDRISSLNDLMTNTTGAFVGVLCAPLAAGALRGLIAALRAVGITVSDAMFPLLVAAVVMVIAAWHPYDFSLDVGNLVPKVRSLLENPWQGSVPSDEGLDFLRCLLFGVAAAAWLRQNGARNPVLVGAAVGVLFTVSLESSQLIIGSRMPGLKDMVVQAGGAVVGAALAPWAVGRWSPALATVAVMAASWFAAAMQMLNPFSLAATPRPIVWVPFLAYYEFTSNQTVTHVIELALMFFPVGFVLTLANPRVPVWVGATITMFVLAVPLEYAQQFIAGRFPDATDVAVAISGGLLGAWVGRAGLSRYRSELGSTPLPQRTPSRAPSERSHGERVRHRRGSQAREPGSGAANTKTAARSDDSIWRYR